MSIFIKELVKRKLSQLSYEDLLNYSEQYGFSITTGEAKEISRYLKNHNVDPFNENDRLKMLHELAQITDSNTANKAQKLFDEIIHSHGLEYLFN